MLRIGLVLLISILSVGWNDTAHSISIPAVLETDPVLSEGDAADDTATWIHPTDITHSIIIGTDKKFELIFYNIFGKKIAQYPVGRINNIDIRSGLQLAGINHQLIVGTDRATNSILMWIIDPYSLELKSVGHVPLRIEPYGLCLGHLEGYQGISVFITTKSGPTQHWVIQDNPLPFFYSQFVQEIPFSSQTEGCVVDDDRSRLFVGEEDFGVWMIDFKNKMRPYLLDRVAPYGRLVADVEGLSIYKKSNTNGFLVVSSQGDNSFHIYDLVDGAHRGRFAVGPGRVDGVTDTDGIEAVSMGIHPNLPEGFLIVQDGTNEEPNGTLRPQNFKIIDWNHIRNVLGLYERYPLGY